VHIEIEEFTESDAEDLEKVFKITWSRSYEYPLEWRIKRQIKKKKIIEEMRSGYHFFGARENHGDSEIDDHRDNTSMGKIMGVYKLKITDEGCFGEHQSILPEYAHKGLASAMYEQFIQYAKTHGCTKNYVNVLEHHTACIHLVKKFGFCKEGPVFEQTEGMRVQRYVRWCSEY